MFVAKFDFVSISTLTCESLSQFLLFVKFVQIVGLVQIDTQDFCFMDLSKIDIWFSSRCYMDLSKLLHAFIKFLHGFVKVVSRNLTWTLDKGGRGV